MDPRSILTILREASPLDLFLVSFIALPFVFGAWLDVFDQLGLASAWKYWSLVVVLAAYVIGVLLMYIGSSRHKLRELAVHQIVAYLTSNSLTMMKLETIKNKIDSSYDDEFLNSLPVHFPDKIRRSVLKDNKPGLARVIEEDNE